MIYQNHQSCSLRVSRGVPQGSVLFSLFINDLVTSLLTSVICCVYADNLAIWCFSLLFPATVEATQGALIRIAGLSTGRFLLNPNKCEEAFVLVDLHQANLQPNLSLFHSAFLVIALQIFSGSSSIALFPFLYTHLCSRSSPYLISKTYAVPLLSHRAKKSLAFLYKAFFSLFSLMLHRISFHLLALPTLLSWNAFTKQPVAP